MHAYVSVQREEPLCEPVRPPGHLPAGPPRPQGQNTQANLFSGNPNQTGNISVCPSVISFLLGVQGSGALGWAALQTVGLPGI
jgi:hypothetical protein